LPKRILLIAVNYNSSKETLDFLQSLSLLDNSLILQVVIVDNSNLEVRDISLKNKCFDIFKNLLFVETPSNLNYFGSVNYSLKQLQISPVQYDFFIISNVDILIQDHSFLNKLFSLNLQNTGIIAPAIISTAQGINQNPYMKNRFKKRLLFYYYVIRQHVILTTIHEKISDFIKKKMSSEVKYLDPPSSIYAPHGAFIIFTNLYFLKNASIDFGLNLFGEELFVAEECFKNNIKVYYEPSLIVLHAEHISTGSVSSRFIVNKKRESVIYFLNKY
jgi:GT2 family glycosyltransferase